MINIDNRTGAVGFNSVIAPGFYPIKLVKVNEETGEILRDENGMAIACSPGEEGELVGKVRSKLFSCFQPSKQLSGLKCQMSME